VRADARASHAYAVGCEALLLLLLGSDDGRVVGRVGLDVAASSFATFVAVAGTRARLEEHARGIFSVGGSGAIGDGIRGVIGGRWKCRLDGSG